MANKDVLLSKIPAQQPFSEQIGGLYPDSVNTQDDGKKVIPCRTCLPFNPATGHYQMPAVLYNAAASASAALQSVSVTGLTALGADTLLKVASVPFYNNGSTWDQARTPSTFHTGTANAIGSTALWTPAAGKKFRVLGYTFTLPSTATSAAGTTITLMDNATAVFTLIVMGTTSGALAVSVPLPGNGYLSTAADNVLNINLSAALTAGVIAVSVWGTEE